MIADIQRAKDALFSIQPDCDRETWVRIGMAFHAAGGDFDSFDHWSAGADSYRAADCRDVWRSFKSTPGGITAGTLFHLARDAGWADGKPSPKRSTKPTEPPRKPPKGTGAVEVWARCEAVTSHPYANAKGASGAALAGLRVVPTGDPLRIMGESMAGALVVPCWTPSGVLSTLQLITPPETAQRLKMAGKKSKLNLPGHSVHGCFVVGELLTGGLVYVVEGIGQAWACWMATGAPAAVTFGAGKTAEVATALRQMDTSATVIICPDRGKEANAHRIASRLGCSVACLPESKPSNFDVNDLLLSDGIEVVRSILEPKSDPSEDEDIAAVFGSDLALSDTFARKAEPLFRWSPGLEWLTVAPGGTHWVRDENLRRYNAAKAVCKAVASDVKNAKLKTAICSAKAANALLMLARSDSAIATPMAAWDADPMMLNTQCNAYDLRTGKSVSRSGLMFRQVTAAAPVAMTTPIWDRFLAEVFAGDLETVEFVQRLAGYFLTGSILEQKLFFFYGQGANGKSVLLDALRAVMGTYATSLPAEALMVQRHEPHPTLYAGLMGKRLAISSELEDGATWAEARVKALTGDATMSARFMRQDFFEFSVTHKHLVAGNFRPRLKGDDFAMARRMVLVPFEQRFEGTRRDPHLPEKLKAEHPGILMWAIQGAAKWVRDGLAVSPKVLAASKEYMTEHNDLDMWIDECCQRNPAATSTTTQLYDSFKRWKEASGEFVPSMRNFSQRLERQFNKSRSDRGRYFIGLSLVDPAGYRGASRGY